MTGTERRTKIVELIQNSEKPLSGTALAKQCDVSRQVIVQDICLLYTSLLCLKQTARIFRRNRIGESEILH